MSKQIQFRRGSATEHANFIGANGEITVDTTNKTLRVHDGENPGGTILAKQSELPDISNADYVVESQLPTAENNYTWYRKYKSGWVEQGGETTNNANSVTLPIEMADTHYTVIRTQCGSGSQQSYYPVWVAGYIQKTTTGFTFGCATATNIWYVCGQSNTSY